MNNEFYTKLQHAAKDIRLSDAERNFMRAALHAHMGIQTTQRGGTRSTKSPYIFLYMPRAAALALVPLILILSAGGTAYAAEGALPGDVLYPVKISVNEQMQSALALSPRAKAQVHVSLAGKRLEEAQALAIQGRLDAPSTAQLQTNLEEHAKEAQEFSKTVAENDPDAGAEISAQLSSSLSANNAVLEDVGDRSHDENIRHDVKKLAAAVRVSVAVAQPEATSSDSSSGEGNGEAKKGSIAVSTSLASTSSTRMATGTASSTTTALSVDGKAAVRVGKRAATELGQTVELFKNTRDSLDPEAATQIQLQLSAMQQLLDTGNTALKAGNTTAAYANFARAYSAAVRLETLLKAASRLGGKILSPLLKVQVSRVSHVNTGSILGTSTEAAWQLQTEATNTADTQSTSDTKVDLQQNKTKHINIHNQEKLPPLKKILENATEE